MEYLTVEVLVWAFFLALLVAIVYSCCMQKCLSDLASRLIKKQCFCDKDAATLEDLGYKKGIYSGLVSFFACNGNYISKVIVKVKNQQEKADTELLFTKKEPVKYYIPEEKNDKRLEKHIKDTISLPKMLLVIALLIAIAFAATTVIDMLRNYASTLTQNKNEVVGVTDNESSLLEEQEQANKAEELENKRKEELQKIEEQAKAELESAKNNESSSMTTNKQADDDKANINSSDADKENINE